MVVLETLVVCEHFWIVSAFVLLGLVLHKYMTVLRWIATDGFGDPITLFWLLLVPISNVHLVMA